jgi:hypothetical protein
MKIGVNYILEDNLNYDLFCLNEGVKLILTNKIWNKFEKNNQKILRFNNWVEILNYFKENEN